MHILYYPGGVTNAAYSRSYSCAAVLVYLSSNISICKLTHLYMIFSLYFKTQEAKCLFDRREIVVPYMFFYSHNAFYSKFHRLRCIFCTICSIFTKPVRRIVKSCFEHACYVVLLITVCTVLTISVVNMNINTASYGGLQHDVKLVMN
jgi:hypothetical protein